MSELHDCVRYMIAAQGKYKYHGKLALEELMDLEAKLDEWKLEAVYYRELLVDICNTYADNGGDVYAGCYRRARAALREAEVGTDLSGQV